jgi:nicotinamidase-related amidase
MASLRSLTRRIDMKKTAFFLCDIQTRFIDLIHGFSGVVSVAQKMSRVADILDIPLVVTEQYVKAFGHTVPEIDISKAVVVQEKTKFSMLVPEVEAFLKEHGTESIVLYGIESHVCVLQTALELLDHQYNVHVLADGVSSMNHREIPVALERLRQAGAAITSSESIIFQLLGDASHPKFKQVSSLVKEWQPKDAVNPLFARNVEHSKI